MKKHKPSINQKPSTPKPTKVPKEGPPEVLVSPVPLSRTNMRDLFDYLTREGVRECDHTLRETQAFIKDRKLNPEPIIEWLQRHGGHCDCEVRLNVLPSFEENRERAERHQHGHFLKGGPRVERTRAIPKKAEQIGSSPSPLQTKGKRAGSEVAGGPPFRRQQTPKDPHAKARLHAGLDNLKRLEKDLMYALTRETSMLRLCREMIRKAKNEQ